MLMVSAVWQAVTRVNHSRVMWNCTSWYKLLWWQLDGSAGHLWLHVPSHIPRVMTGTAVTVYEGVLTWKHFPYYWSFVWGIRQWPVDFPHLTKSQQYRVWWYLCCQPEQAAHCTFKLLLVTPLCHCDITVMCQVIMPYMHQSQLPPWSPSTTYTSVVICKARAVNIICDCITL